MIPAVAIFHLMSAGAQELSERDGKRDGPAGLHRKGLYVKRTRTGARGLHSKYAAGDVVDTVLCYGADLDKYRSECAAPLFPDMWNTWTLFKATTSSDTPAGAADKALAFMTWLNNVVLGGKIRHVTAEAYGARVGEKLDGPIVTTPPIATRQNVCDILPTLEASSGKPPFYAVNVRFVYRGTEVGTPWPAYKMIAGVKLALCPVGARWLLDTIYAPSQEHVPAASTDSILPPYYSTHAPSAPGDWDLSTKIVVGGGVVLGLGLLAGYVVRSFR